MKGTEGGRFPFLTQSSSQSRRNGEERAVVVVSAKFENFKRDAGMRGGGEKASRSFEEASGRLDQS